ncbi:hypothetical protein ACSBR2_019032 [Camellia fascicularis]
MYITWGGADGTSEGKESCQARVRREQRHSPVGVRRDEKQRQLNSFGGRSHLRGHEGRRCQGVDNCSSLHDETPALRPSMRMVVQMLEEAEPCNLTGIIVSKDGKNSKT